MNEKQLIIKNNHQFIYDRYIIEYCIYPQFDPRFSLQLNIYDTYGKDENGHDKLILHEVIDND